MAVEGFSRTIWRFPSSSLSVFIAVDGRNFLTVMNTFMFRSKWWFPPTSGSFAQLSCGKWHSDSSEVKCATLWIWWYQKLVFPFEVREVKQLEFSIQWLRPMRFVWYLIENKDSDSTIEESENFSGDQTYLSCLNIKGGKCNVHKIIHIRSDVLSSLWTQLLYVIVLKMGFIPKPLLSSAFPFYSSLKATLRLQQIRNPKVKKIRLFLLWVFFSSCFFLCVSWYVSFYKYRKFSSSASSLSRFSSFRSILFDLSLFLQGSLCLSKLQPGI